MNDAGGAYLRRYRSRGLLSDLQAAIDHWERAVRWLDKAFLLSPVAYQRGQQERRADLLRDLPIASIGQPEVWTLPEVYPPDRMPHPLRAKLDEADFYLVRLACSFRPLKDEKQVEWARFRVHLLPDNAGRQPVAFDLHPVMVTQEVKRNVRISLNPSLKFSEIEGEIGEVEFGGRCAGNRGGAM